MVEHEQAELVLRDGVYRTRIRRQLRNIGDQPVTQYLIRIVVDRYPGDPERSNQLYRHDPLTWEEIALSAMCGDEPMAWRVKHDRDAAKEVWLLFENIDGRFPGAAAVVPAGRQMLRPVQAADLSSLIHSYHRPLLSRPVTARGQLSGVAKGSVFRRRRHYAPATDCPRDGAHAGLDLAR